MTSQLPALCWSCARLDRSATDPNTGGLLIARCEAFPDRIPVEIAQGADHREPRGDEVDGLVYARAKTQDAEDMFAVWRVFHDAVFKAG